ncbi:MAG: anthranilate synthase component I family protein [Bacteroidetes bacterium]|nr:anthranilate synthase component I family protein [Bacteroidota bacterium]
MSRVFVSFRINDFYKTKLQVLYWANRFNTCCFLDNHEYASKEHVYECLVGAGVLESVKTNVGNAFGQLKEFSLLNNDWFFGHFAFDLKNEIESLSSSHPDHIQFPDLFFFVPEIILELKKNEISIGLFGSNHEKIFNAILETVFVPTIMQEKSLQINSRFSKKEYIDTVEKLKQHILRGDCYEINFCQEFFAEDVLLEPITTYYHLSNISPTPFGSFYKLDDKYLLCASPERYLKKNGSLLLTQPMKGTSSRNKYNAQLDADSKNELFASAKDRSENVMVVDLVRNDLSKVSKEGTVHVDELYGIYTFPQVHQMVSTITGTALGELNWVDIIEATFPMGSMTGAPKIKVLKLIEQYEKTKRGLFSGALGYVKPDKDFDFNVVIRSLLYNHNEKYISYQVGSGITFYSDAEKEFEECMLKAEAIKKVLTDKS